MRSTAASSDNSSSPAAATACSTAVDPAAALHFDEKGPLVFSVGRLGPKYWDWVDHPVPGKPRFFKADALEACSKTVWWVVPAIWLPVYLLASAAALHASSSDADAAAPQQQQQRALRGAAHLAAQQLAGVLLWQLLEYCIHRFAFHARGDSYWAITIHFLFHGCHHKFPMDAERLVFPPVPATPIAASIYGALRLLLCRGGALGVMSGVLLGYVAYDCIHYCLHHGGKLPGSYLKSLRLRHNHHHYQDHSRGYQISSALFDAVFGTKCNLERQRRKSEPGAQWQQ